eukprot:Skav201680  [mRNA]  locus=scaffold641:477066:479357:- [translate_table: standard]
MPVDPRTTSDCEDLRAKVVDERLGRNQFRTCSAAWAARGDKWRAWQYKKAENLVAQTRSSMSAQDLKSIGLTPKFVQKCLDRQLLQGGSGSWVKPSNV